LLSAPRTDPSVRLGGKFRDSLDSIQGQIDELSSQKKYEVDVISEVIKLTQNVYEANKKAPYELKRQYLGCLLRIQKHSDFMDQLDRLSRLHA